LSPPRAAGRSTKSEQSFPKVAAPLVFFFGKLRTFGFRKRRTFGTERDSHNPEIHPRREAGAFDMLRPLVPQTTGRSGAATAQISPNPSRKPC
jgi:hypothetical protein